MSPSVSPSLASNVSWRGCFDCPPHCHVATHSPPSLQTWVRGSVWIDLPHSHVTTTSPPCRHPLPSITSNTSQRECLNWPVTSPPRHLTTTSPSTPLPHFKRELAKTHHTWPPLSNWDPPCHHPFPLPCFKHKLEGAFLVFTHHTITHSSSLASNASWRGHF
jgi:hypothetical protein